MKPIGPQAPPGLAAPSEHLPTEEHAVLKGHDGPVLSVRFNTQGTYCLSCGKVGGRGGAERVVVGASLRDVALLREEAKRE